MWIAAQVICGTMCAVNAVEVLNHDRCLTELANMNLKYTGSQIGKKIEHKYTGGKLHLNFGCFDYKGRQTLRAVKKAVWGKYGPTSKDDNIYWILKRRF